MAVSVVLCYAMLVGVSVGVEVKDRYPHAPFPDLDEKITTDPQHIVFTKEELANFNGRNPKLPIYVAVKGVVFDVTNGKAFYGVGKAYNVLTGKDASRAIAKWSLVAENMNDNLDGLSKEELDRLEENFHNVYMAKYPVLGYMRGHEPQIEDNLTWRKEDL